MRLNTQMIYFPEGRRKKVIKPFKNKEMKRQTLLTIVLIALSFAIGLVWGALSIFLIQMP